MSSLDILNKFIETDPTGDKGTYVQWIIRSYLNKGIRFLEDLSRTKYAISLFNKFKNKLPQDKRDINRIKSLPELEDLVTPFEEEPTGKEDKKQELDKIYKETTIIYKGENGTILIPKTKQASCFWGRGQNGVRLLLSQKIDLMNIIIKAHYI